ncbi:hypothetical protein [Burkholderia pseudomallei]|uniref:hypothetical protein n=1 Tax=Burkholderia pseudomallei TaxID=28450 RepID=UPI000F05ECEB|nr:hypothetical protein [Burkholderia pseudomallei]VBI24607.1 Uncharacterised protein [Burkholderia pseudomallei]
MNEIYKIDADSYGEMFNGFPEEKLAREVITTAGVDAFDAIEISGCMFVAGDCVEACTEPDDVPAFFSVYLHWKTGGVECVGDLATAERARAYAAQIRDAFGWPIEIDRTDTGDRS